ncbi:AbrB/MazE/SpoVT family DNA-binding domain-containing protein [Lichenicoccus roseus]|uniref:Uncharacterized protein n=1 Tax=Lichenicoccus roseus TaxID=2683649 RepID=A0A5R9J7Z9_9PROT|nr:AbrB/MazE/SpoVT family DNA-binding domain-containing protein [Lichenicoccus roseus]TLU71476.1 hypothetical protein FE263_16385 [Lichenicoccus roseus]
MFDDVDQYEAVFGPDGSLIIPATLAEKLGWRPGHRLLLEQIDDGFLGTAIEVPRGRILNAVSCCRAHQTNFTT